MTKHRTIRKGVYLVVDPAPGLDYLLPRVARALAGGVAVVQVWNHWAEGQDRPALIDALCGLAHRHGVPVLVNEEWPLLKTTALDGVHFDSIPGSLPSIRAAVGRPLLVGITCGNDLGRIEWAAANGLDYISFCSMFPSPSAGACEIVSKETVRQARKLTALPIFVAGGITLENLEELAGTGLDGVALISAILNADDPQGATAAFQQKLNTLKHIS